MTTSHSRPLAWWIVVTSSSSPALATSCPAGSQRTGMPADSKPAGCCGLCACRLVFGNQLDALRGPAAGFMLMGG